MKPFSFFSDLEPRQGSWSENDCKNFQQMTVDKVFKANIKFIRNVTDNDSEQYVAELILIDPTNNHNISERLVQLHRAKYK